MASYCLYLVEIGSRTFSRCVKSIESTWRGLKAGT